MRVIYLLTFFKFCVSHTRCVYESVQVPKNNRRAPAPLAQGLHMAVNLLRGVLGSELGSSREAVHALLHGAVSPARTFLQILFHPWFFFFLRLTLSCFFRLVACVWMSDIQCRLFLNSRDHVCPVFGLTAATALVLLDFTLVTHTLVLPVLPSTAQTKPMMLPNLHSDRTEA